MIEWKVKEAIIKIKKTYFNHVKFRREFPKKIDVNMMMKKKPKGQEEKDYA